MQTPYFSMSRVWSSRDPVETLPPDQQQPESFTVRGFMWDDYISWMLCLNVSMTTSHLKP
jgi:hypothetical protein